VPCWIALLLAAGNPLTLRALEIGHPEELFGGVLCVAAALPPALATPWRPACCWVSPVTWELHAVRRPPVLSLAVTLCAWFTLVWLPPYALPDTQALAYLAWSVPLTGLLGARLIWGERLRPEPALDGWTSPTGIRS
jgi:hypothetical protein